MCAGSNGGFALVLAEGWPQAHTHTTDLQTDELAIISIQPVARNIVSKWTPNVNFIFCHLNVKMFKQYKYSLTSYHRSFIPDVSKRQRGESQRSAGDSLKENWTASGWRLGLGPWFTPFILFSVRKHPELSVRVTSCVPNPDCTLSLSRFLRLLCVHTKKNWQDKVFSKPSHMTKHMLCPKYCFLILYTMYQHYVLLITVQCYCRLRAWTKNNNSGDKIH